jgi:hypothetical protein
MFAGRFEKRPIFTRRSPAPTFHNGSNLRSHPRRSRGVSARPRAPTSGRYFSTYTYAGAKNDLSGRGFLGFQQVGVTDQQTHVVQTTRTNTLFPLTGTVLEQTRTLGATVLSDTINSYATIPTAPVQGTPTFVYLAVSTTSGREVDGSSLPSTTTTNADPDAHARLPPEPQRFN